MNEPSMAYIDSMLMMMNKYCEGVLKDSYNLTVKILEETNLTSCCTMVGDETEGLGENLSVSCYGFVTILNLASYKVGRFVKQNEKFSNQLMKFLKEKCGQKNEKLFKAIESCGPKGLVIKERYYNLQDEVSELLWGQIRTDYEWLLSNEEEDDEGPSYAFDNLLYIMRYLAM